jgi:hypothetical protein
VSKNAYPYPPDEFDQVDLNSRPKEVHAARRGAWSRVWPFLLVIVLVPSIAFVAVHFLADRLPGGDPADTPPAAGPSQDESIAPPSEQPSEPAEPAESNTPEPPPTSEAPPPPPEPVVDKTVKVTVYNAGQTKGAAAAAAEQLTTAGFTQAASAYPPNPAEPAAATVYYSTEVQKDTAAEVARVLAITAVELNPQVAGGNVVGVVR